MALDMFCSPLFDGLRPAEHNTQIDNNNDADNWGERK